MSLVRVQNFKHVVWTLMRTLFLYISIRLLIFTRFVTTTLSWRWFWIVLRSALDGWTQYFTIAHSNRDSISRLDDSRVCRSIIILTSLRLASIRLPITFPSTNLIVPHVIIQMTHQIIFLLQNLILFLLLLCLRSTSSIWNLNDGLILSYDVYCWLELLNLDDIAIVICCYTLMAFFSFHAFLLLIFSRLVLSIICCHFISSHRVIILLSYFSLLHFVSESILFCFFCSYLLFCLLLAISLYFGVFVCSV